MALPGCSADRSSSSTEALLPPSSSEVRFGGCGSQLGDPTAGAGRAGERHHVDQLVLDEGLADDRTGAGYEVEHARREPDRVDDLGQQVGDTGHQLGRVDHDGAAGDQRGRDLGGDLVQRVVPGGDRPDNADRLPDQHGVARAALPLHLVDQVGHRGEADDRQAGLDHDGELPGGAHLGGGGQRDLLGAGLQAFRDRRAGLDPVVQRGRRPSGQGASRGAYGLVDVLDRALGDGAEDLLGERVGHRQGAGAGRGDEGAVDVQGAAGVLHGCQVSWAAGAVSRAG